MELYKPKEPNFRLRAPNVNLVNWDWRNSIQGQAEEMLRD